MMELTLTSTGMSPSGFKQAAASAGDPSHARLREVFDDFVGQTFYGQMLASLRNTVQEPAYFHGGQAEEIFQSQLDRVLAEKLSDASAHQFTQPMFDLFTMWRK
jgi:hypothetical protein